MVTRKPVGSSAQSPVYEHARLIPSSSEYNSLPSTAQPGLGQQKESQEVGFDWDTCDDTDAGIRSTATIPPAGPANFNATTWTGANIMDISSSQAWKVGDAPPPIPTLGTLSQDGGDLGIRNMSLESPATARSSPETNPFLRKRSGTSTPGDMESSAAVWDDGTSNEVAPQLSLPEQHPLISLDSDFVWNDTRESALVPENDIENAGKGKASASLPQPQLEIPPTTATAQSDVETPQTKARRERNEVYQIKHIRWDDATSRQNPRNSPILIQNANGPCPLLALVNALVLSTPPELHTALIETLRTREQVSLGLLIDAVFDELMSDRRSGNSPNLPDVGDLYAFLVTLHTGMNVNPRFVPRQSAFQSQDELDQEVPGSFEDTREMNLYGTFAIPLIHGWLPHRHELAYQAFHRTAQSYEDVQNVQFRQEDLEERLRTSQISFEEQALLEDLITMKQFFIYWPTQLTAHGLDVIKKFMQPGQIAILFRNDHFSMLYREPKSSRLMTLVTDAGYAGHDEIVWESLVDINGSNSELFSGDFRSVSHDGPAEGHHNEDDWETVGNKQSRSRRNEAPPSSSANVQSSPPNNVLSPKAIEAGQIAMLSDDSTYRARSASEQEDHDLALALQLQEEEEERQRDEAVARRAHEDELSQQYISQQPGNTRNGIRIPPRRSGMPQANASPATAPTTDRTSQETAPPPYEQAAGGRPFHPPRTHPSSEHAPLARQGSTYAQNTAAVAQTSPASSGRRRMSARQSLVNQIPAGGASEGRQPNTLQRRAGRVETGFNSAQSDKEDKCSMM